MMRGAFRLLAVVAVPFAAAAEMERATPESQGVPSAAILKWIDACEKAFAAPVTDTARDAIHGFTLVRHGKVIAEGTWKPFDTLNAPHKLYSHTKSFTSTAIGFLVDDGKLDLDERVVDIFADKAPADPSANLRAMRVRDLLTMNTGAAYTDAERRDPSGDWERAFLANVIDDPPGTKFRYDSGATHMLSAIVQRRSGKRMTEFLADRLFGPLGFGEVRCTQSPTGVDCGGWGMSLTTRDLARFGQFLLQKGRWGDRRLLSPDWVSLATTRQTWSSAIVVQSQTIGSGNDWAQGYGFQFWRCQHGAFRADGAFGQITVVFPKEDAVLSVNAGIGPMQKELDVVWENLLPALGSAAPLPENPAALAALEKRCAELSFAPISGTRDGAERFDGLKFLIDANPRGLATVEFNREGEGWRADLRTRAGMNRFPVGFGKWERSTLEFDPEPYETLGTIHGVQAVAASGAVRPDGTFLCRVYYVEDVNWIDFRLSVKDGKAELKGALQSMSGCTLTGKASVPPRK